MLNYEGQFKVFPISMPHYPEGGVDGNGLSGMAGILPFFEQGNFYRSINFGGPVSQGLGMARLENRSAIKTTVPFYYCPSDNSFGAVKTNVWNPNPPYTDFDGVPFAVINYAGVLGPHNLANASLFGGLPACHSYAMFHVAACSGTFWRHSFMAPVTAASFCDGLSQTTIIGEVLPEYDDFKYWALGNGTWASTHSPINWIPNPNVPWNGWPNQMGFRSRHPGGAQFTCGDGHVTFLNETLDREIYRALSTHSGRENVSF